MQKFPGGIDGSTFGIVQVGVIPPLVSPSGMGETPRL